MNVPARNRRCVGAMVGMCLVIANGALAGSLKGRVVDSKTGKGLAKVSVRAFGAGRSTGSGARSEGDGSYLIADLPAGRYAVCVPAGENHRPGCVAGIDVPGEGAATVNLRVDRSLLIDGDSWVQPYPSFAQSFVASGLGLTMIGVKGFGDGRRVDVQVVDGAGPDGALKGPARVTAPVGGEGTEVVQWAGAEVPTLPGEVCTVRMTGVDGKKWVPGVAGRGDVYPLGSAWFHGSPRPESDLGILICEDNDGLRTDYAAGGGWRTWRVRAAGQTFTALSQSITFASARLSGVHGLPVYVRFSIHEEGPGGRQIGPSKMVPAGEDAAVAWVAGEIPVEAGKTYYLHIESLSGEIFLAAVQPGGYAAGRACFDAAAANDWDLCATVAGQIGDGDFARMAGRGGPGAAVELVNPSFETDMKGWAMEGPCGAVVGCDGGVAPMWGTRMFGWTNLDKGEGSRVFVHQQVRVERGRRYVLSGSIYTDHQGGRSSDVKARLLVLPEGGTDWRNNDRIETSQWYATEGQWRRGSVEFEAAAEAVTVGFDLEQRWNLASSSVYVDGAYLERIGGK